MLMMTKVSTGRSRRTSLTIGLAVAIVATIGSIIYSNTRAAGAVLSLEPENGTLQSTAVVQADTGASGGKAVKFPAPATSGTILTNVYTTAYTYFDNTPPGSAQIAFPHSEYSQTLHNLAGGIGTYADPVTLAVGHSITNGVSTPDFPPGTRFYFPDLRKYTIVEDVCGDGSTPQNGPCHNVSTAPSGTSIWLDIWIGGSSSDSATALDNCASIVTDSTGELHTVVKNPSSNYAVNYPGAVYHSGYCIQPTNRGFGNTLVTQ
jgi:hypothetical protein